MVKKMQPESNSHLKLVSNAGSDPLPQQYFNTGSGGGGGDMDGRVKRLEDDVRDIKTVLRNVELLLTGIKTRLDHTPTTIAMVIMILTVFGLGIAVPSINNSLNKPTGVADEPKRSTKTEQAPAVYQGAPKTSGQ
ncbi:MAG: hypothetical protein SFX19_00930 [Alphaproteobacteria bacterium]|nr:hypothetical protein [Alphaproteobacteria bacterium]